MHTKFWSQILNVRREFGISRSRWMTLKEVTFQGPRVRRWVPEIRRVA